MRDVLADRARRDERGDALLGEELVDLRLLLERLPNSSSSSQYDFGVFGKSRTRAGSIWPSCFFSSSSVSRLASGWKPMSSGSGRPFMTIAPRSLPRYFSKSSFDLDLDDDRRAGERRRQRRRPGARIAGDPHVLRLGHLDREAIDRPAAARRAVRLERGVDQPPARQLIARPLAGLAQRPAIR